MSPPCFNIRVPSRVWPYQSEVAACLRNSLRAADSVTVSEPSCTMTRWA
ncbi:Uncharacterised protein [Bordetella pertussis]|nr:Uncharacterised protein [Bordetella pertussis]CFW39752.1 Uncharacterised protein [Bordetella pertussis]